MLSRSTLNADAERERLMAIKSFCAIRPMCGCKIQYSSTGEILELFTVFPRRLDACFLVVCHDSRPGWLATRSQALN